MSYVDDIRDTNESNLAAAAKAVDAAQQVCPLLIPPALQVWADRQAFGLGVLIPDGWVDDAADYVIEVVLAVLAHCETQIAIMRIANQYLGSPDTLRSAADALNDMGSKADALAIQKSALAGLVSWDDPPASRKYDLTVDDQAQALEEISAFTAALAGALGTHADDIENYYVQLALIIGGAVASIGGIIAAILGIIAAIPTGGVTLAASIVGLIASVIGIAATIIGIVQMVMTATQGTTAKVEALSAELPEWKVPAFAIMG